MLGKTHSQMLILTLVVLLSVAAPLAGAQASMDRAFHVDVPALPLGEALKSLADQGDFQIVFEAGAVKDRMTDRLVGTMLPEEALKAMLASTELAYVRIGGVFVVKARKTSETASAVQMDSSSPTEAGTTAGAVQLAQTDSSTPSAQQDSRNTQLEEIVVTAQKRAERLQDVPLSITALRGEDIERRGLVSMQDYLSSIPGVNYMDFGIGTNQIVIRGIGIGLLEQSTVSSYLGDLPLTSPVGATATDIKLVDMQRVEVLRGPQGTLYGSGSMGGTVRNIPVAPNLEKFEGKVSAGYAAVDESDDYDNQLIGVVNLPLAKDKLALRIAAYRFDNAGYIDLISEPGIEAAALATGTTVALARDTSSSTYTGGRATLLWQPADNLTVTLTQVMQDLEGKGPSNVLLTRERYEATALDMGDVRHQEDFDATNMVLEYDAGWASFLSSSTWIDGRVADNIDLGPLVSWAAEQRNRSFKEGFAQEMRLTSKFQGPVQVTGGIYYEDFEFPFTSEAEWLGDQTLKPGFFGPDPVFLRLLNDQSVTQKAVFGEVSYAINPSWDILLGARWFDYDRRAIASTLFGITPPTGSSLRAEESDTNLKAGINFKPARDTLLYAQWAQGFRLGRGVLGAPAAVCDVDGNGLLDFTNVPVDPRQLDSDGTSNVELGGKFALLNNRLRINTAVFHIDWDDLPISVGDTSPTCVALISVNGGKARSRGIELETAANLTSALSVTLGAGYVDAEFRSNDIGRVGGRLPLSSRVNGNFGIQYGFDLLGNESFARADVAYIGSYLNDVAGLDPESGDFTKLNLRAGISFNGVQFEMYGNNVTNENAHTHYANAQGVRIHPRTIGVSLSKSF